MRTTTTTTTTIIPCWCVVVPLAKETRALHVCVVHSLSTLIHSGGLPQPQLHICLSSSTPFHHPPPCPTLLLYFAHSFLCAQSFPLAGSPGLCTQHRMCGKNDTGSTCFLLSHVSNIFPVHNVLACVSCENLLFDA
jgi:hypothetical protein